MERKFALGERVIVTQRYLAQRAGSEGIIVAIRDHYRHPYGVLFDYREDNHHKLSLIGDHVQLSRFMPEHFYRNNHVLELEIRRGYWLHPDCLEIAQVTYNPSQQGDTDDDI